MSAINFWLTWGAGVVGAIVLFEQRLLSLIETTKNLLSNLYIKKLYTTCCGS